MRLIIAIVSAAAILAGCAGSPPTPTMAVRQVEGERSIASILDDFDHGGTDVMLSSSVQQWGPRIGETKATAGIVEAGPGGSGKAGRFDFKAAFDSPYSLDTWKDSGLTFVGRIEMGQPGKGSDGIRLRIKPEGFTIMELYLVQDDGIGGTRTSGLSLLANDGEWKDWTIPFSSFTPTERGASLDTRYPLSIEIYIPYQENWGAFHFRTGSSASCDVLVDDIGFWIPKGSDDGTLLAGFDDERDTLPIQVDLYGSATWVDYSTSDAGVGKIDTGVKGQKLTLAVKPGGPAGSYAELTGRLELDPSIAQVHAAGQALTLFLKMPVGRPISGAKAISFLVRSDLFSSGSFEIQDEQNDRYYGHSFQLSDSWSTVRLPFARLMADTQSLGDAPRVADRVRIQISLELPPDLVEKAAAKGVLEFTIGLDSIVLER